MKSKVLTMLCIAYLFPLSALSQDLQTTIISEFRVGYSSNTYLNPFFSEWDRTYNSGYGLSATFGQLFWDKNRHKFELNGGYVFEPFFSEQSTWHGHLAYARYIGQISSKLQAGLNIGTSGFQSDFDRNLHWIQPYITWFPSSFTSIHFKAGSNFREYVGFQDSLNINNRLDSYALEMESWIGFRWQLKAGIYGNLENLPAIQNGISTSFSLGHLFVNGSRITSELQFINYNSEFTTTIDQGGGPGGPFGPPGSTTETQSINDQIWRIKLEGSYPVSSSVSAFISAERSLYQSSSLNDGIGDIQVSGGMRFSLTPNLNTSGKQIIDPIWAKEADQYTVRIKYRGNGNLYLVGDFNNWEKPGIPLRKESKNTYKTNIKIEPGLYEYRVLVINGSDKKWLEFSNNTSTVKDGFGGTNALKIVE